VPHHERQVSCIGWNLEFRETVIAVERVALWTGNHGPAEGEAALFLQDRPTHRASMTCPKASTEVLRLWSDMLLTFRSSSTLPSALCEAPAVQLTCTCRLTPSPGKPDEVGGRIIEGYSCDPSQVFQNPAKFYRITDAD
jgi:hypothetical protein